MKSFCIKNNNDNILNYLLIEFQNIDMDNIVVSQNVFKYYKNIIIHYKGNDDKLFITKISEILTKCIINFYEKNIVKRVINCDFFYFDPSEKELIYDNCFEILDDKESDEFYIRKEKILLCLIEYITCNKYFILDGFVNFRLFEYNSIVEECVDVAVNKYVIDKEYREFIQLLRGYVKSQKNKSGIIHVIYSRNEPILMDDEQNILVYDKEFEQPKYLSDITFSSKDYCLNALLNLVPEKIIVHVISDEDEFIETLKLIFGNRVAICKECSICRTFGLIKVH